MAKPYLLNPDQLRQLFRYEPETGKLYWRERGPEWFKRHKDMTRWNTCFAGKVAGGVSGVGHIYVGISNKPHLAHRVIWAMETGQWPEGDIDHINGDPADNRLTNLRDVPHQVNQQNIRRRELPASGQMNIYPQAGKFRVKVGDKHIGYFTTMADAIAARDAALIAKGYHENHGRREDAPIGCNLAGAVSVREV